MSVWRAHIAVALLLAVALAGAAAAQTRRRGFGGFRRPTVRLAKADDFDGNFLFCRIVFRNASNGDGNGWGVGGGCGGCGLTCGE